MAGDSVCLAYLHTTNVAHSWHTSYTSMLLYDMRPGGPAHLRGGFLAQFGSNMGFDDARNRVVGVFLDEKDADWLLWVDSDMGFEPDALERLMEVADKDDRPIVGGLCFSHEPNGDDEYGGTVFRIKPTIYALDEREDMAGFTPVYGYPANELVQVGATGSAFILIHRSVFEAIRAKHGDFWYGRIQHPKNPGAFGEDLSFCLRAALCGFPIHAHTGVRTNHLKFTYLTEPGYYAQIEAPPATEPVDVIVPVLHRPQNIRPFMESLKATTGLAKALFVIEPDDLMVMAEVRKHGGEYTVHAGTFAEKVNHAYETLTDETTAPWLFLVGDDVKFHPGWLDHAQHVAKAHKADVVGTNDLGNPRVTSGEHATHLLVRRTYIERMGASWDGPGVVCHEGYGHWFVDDEIVTAAKQRGVWAMALGSKVEHMHPLFGKAKEDAVYDKGRESSAADHGLFLKRVAKNAGKRALAAQVPA